jgi:hypothetical protein
VGVGEYIDADRAQRTTWDAASLQNDPVYLAGKHNGQGPAVDTLDAEMSNLEDPRWRGYILVLARVKWRLLSLADRLLLRRVGQEQTRH